MSTTSFANNVIESNEEHGAKDRSLEEEERGQNIFIRFHDGPRETNPPTSAPTALPMIRDYNFRACIDNDAGGNITLAGVADVHFVYDIETTKELTSNEETKMLNALETAMINSIFDSECGGGNQRRLGSVLKRRLEIHSISSGNRAKLNGDCIVTTDEATVCSRYDGSVKVGYTDSGNNNNDYKAGNSALRIVSMDMNQDVYVDVLNSALGVETQESNSTEVGNSTATTAIVKRVSYVGTSFYDTTESSELMADGSQQNGSLTTMGKIFVPVMAVLFVGAILVMYLGYRKRKENQRLARLAVLRAKEDDLYQRRQDRPYRDPFDADVQDLALRSTNQDVHRCNKTNCLACMQQLPIQLEELATKRKREDYTHPKVEVVDLDQGGESESVFSGLTGGPRTVGSSVWSPFGRKSNVQQPKIHVDESVDDTLGGFIDNFYDEPRSVAFVRINSMPDSLDGRESRTSSPAFSALSSEDYNHGTRSRIVDHTGQVRQQLEL